MTTPFLEFLYYLKAGDKINYIDLFGRSRQIIYIKDTGMVKAIKSQDYCLQQAFHDENGSLVHIPVNCWEVAGIFPCRM